MNAIQFQQILDNSQEQFIQLYEGKKASYDEQVTEIIEYFSSHNVSITEKFNLKKMTKNFNSDTQTMTTLLCNMDDYDVMKKIAKGKYDEFDIFDSTLFNDDYEDMMEDLGFDLED